MNAFHSLWTKPNNNTFSPEPFEILTSCLSALLWRKYNGEITMVCDSVGADFFYDTNLYKIWNNMIVALDEIPEQINPKTYWAAGKLFALKEFSSPIVGIDTDFLVWEKINFSSDICAIHSEDLKACSYPDLPDFLEFGKNFDFSKKAYNTAFFYINDNEFLNYYTDTAINFMLNYSPDDTPLPYMLFAEQRLFSMCAEKLQKKVFELSSVSELFSEKNRTFTHLWGYKDTLRKNPDLKNVFCKKLLSRINSDFPEYSKLFSELRI